MKINSRIKKVTENMKAEGLNQILITSTPSVFYLTGLWIEPLERMLAVHLTADGNLTLCGNELFSIDTASCDFDCLLHTDSDNPIGDLVKLIKPGTIGIDKFWPANFLLPLISARTDISPRLGSGPIDKARMYKDSDEIELMRRASKINDKAVEAAISQLRDGISEKELAAFLQDCYSTLGADFPIGTQIVCFGANAADPHHTPTGDIINPGDCALFDIFTPIDRYWCDMTRTVYFRSVSQEQEKVYEIVREANQAAIDFIRPGVRMWEIDKAARDIITAHGYGPKFIHRLGHGCGIECHESPNCSSVSDEIAAPGMVFSIEPGVYLDGRHGVRIEDLVLVTETGCEVLNAYTKELQVIG